MPNQHKTAKCMNCQQVREIIAFGLCDACYRARKREVNRTPEARAEWLADRDNSVAEKHRETLRDACNKILKACHSARAVMPPADWASIYATATRLMRTCISPGVDSPDDLGVDSPHLEPDFEVIDPVGVDGGLEKGVDCPHLAPETPKPEAATAIRQVGVIRLTKNELHVWDEFRKYRTQHPKASSVQRIVWSTDNFASLEDDQRRMSIHFIDCAWVCTLSDSVHQFGRLYKKQLTVIAVRLQNASEKLADQIYKVWTNHKFDQSSAEPAPPTMITTVQTSQELRHENHLAIGIKAAGCPFCDKSTSASPKYETLTDKTIAEVLPTGLPPLARKNMEVKWNSQTPSGTQTSDGTPSDKVN
jgi:hypothetical protein